MTCSSLHLKPNLKVTAIWPSSRSPTPSPAFSPEPGAPRSPLFPEQRRLKSSCSAGTALPLQMPLGPRAPGTLLKASARVMRDARRRSWDVAPRMPDHSRRSFPSSQTCPSAHLPHWSQSVGEHKGAGSGKVRAESLWVPSSQSEPGTQGCPLVLFLTLPAGLCLSG